MPASNAKLIKGLNEALSLEYSTIVRCQTWAASVGGFLGAQFAGRLRAMAAEELPHAQQLSDRIVRLGGVPHVVIETVRPLYDLDDVLRALLEEERRAVALYRKLFSQISKKDLILWETIEHIFEDELRHLEELEQLVG